MSRYRFSYRADHDLEQIWDYIAISDSIEVVRVIHGARDIQSLLKREL